MSIVFIKFSVKLTDVLHEHLLDNLEYYLNQIKLRLSIGPYIHILFVQFIKYLLQVYIEPRATFDKATDSSRFFPI